MQMCIKQEEALHTSNNGIRCLRIRDIGKSMLPQNLRHLIRTRKWKFCVILRNRVFMQMKDTNRRCIDFLTKKNLSVGMPMRILLEVCMLLITTCVFFFLNQRESFPLFHGMFIFLGIVVFYILLPTLFGMKFFVFPHCA